MDLSEHKIDWETQPDEEALELLERRFSAYEGVTEEELDVAMENALKSSPKSLRIAGKVRDLVSKLGIPGLLIYNGGKAIAVGAGAYIICPGDTEVKALAAMGAGASLLAASPTLWTAGALIGTKIGKRALKSIASPKP
ncbi:MAG: hypothetical protein NTZ25_04775 [Candidatus Peregrinibacteria bacterium]|nr:hypothetical protein [Candidatus Peregrinibacteria bacterium]